MGDDVGGSVAANKVVVAIVLGVFAVGVDVGLIVSVCTTAVGLGLGVVGATLGGLGATLGGLGAALGGLGATLGGLGAALGGRLGALGAPLGVVGKLVGKTVIVGTDVGDQVKGMVVVIVVPSAVTLTVGLLVGLAVNTWAVGIGVAMPDPPFSILSISSRIKFGRGGSVSEPPFTGINSKSLKELMVFSLMKLGH